jgi:hypothetical protein
MEGVVDLHLARIYLETCFFIKLDSSRMFLPRMDSSRMNLSRNYLSNKADETVIVPQTRVAIYTARVHSTSHNTLVQVKVATPTSCNTQVRG